MCVKHFKYKIKSFKKLKIIKGVISIEYPNSTSNKFFSKLAPIRSLQNKTKQNKTKPKKKKKKKKKSSLGPSQQILGSNANVKIHYYLIFYK